MWRNRQPGFMNFFQNFLRRSLTRLNARVRAYTLCGPLRPLLLKRTQEPFSLSFPTVLRSLPAFEIRHSKKIQLSIELQGSGSTDQKRPYR